MVIENWIDLWITVPDYSSLTVLLKGPSAASNIIQSVYFDTIDHNLLQVDDIIKYHTCVLMKLKWVTCEIRF